MEQKLNERQIKFCEEYVYDWNGARAARAAGYSEKTAKEMAYELLTKPHIQAHIEFLKTDTARLAGVSILRNVEELRNIAYSSIAHMHNQWISLTDFEELTDEQKRAIESIETKTVITESGKQIEYVKIKLHSKIKAMELMNKMLGFNQPEKVKMEVEVTELTPQERAARIAELSKKIQK